MAFFLAMVATSIDSAQSIYNYNVFRPFAFCTIAQLNDRTGKDYRKLCSNNAHVILVATVTVTNSSAASCPQTEI